jgi:hypothetical protein
MPDREQQCKQEGNRRQRNVQRFLIEKGQTLMMRYRASQKQNQRRGNTEPDVRNHDNNEKKH